MISRRAGLFAAAAAVVLGAGSARTAPRAPAGRPPVGGDSSEMDIVEAAQAAGTFTMLLRAVRQAGLEAAMKTPGPFTVFAPTDAAFAAVPPAVSRRLMNPANRAELAKVLSYHVLAGRLFTRDLGPMPRAAETLIGAPVVLNPTGPRVRVNDATITTADMRVSNGVVHVIDKVLMPAMPIQPRM